MSTATATATITQPSAAPDLTAVKSRQQAAWSSGDYAVVGTTLQIVGEMLCEALDLRAGQTRARRRRRQRQRHARRSAPLVRRDRRPTMCRRCSSAAAPVRGRRLAIEFQEADAEALPFADGDFDVVVSTFGVMFTADQDKAAAEMLRVCQVRRQDRPRQLDARRLHRPAVQDYRQALPPPAGVKSPALWGTRARIAELFGRTPLRSRSRRATSCSAIARRSTGSTCSGPTTARS